MSALRLRITGRVQGVSYRAWAVGVATELGLDGWVRNRNDGSVEALAVGDDSAVEAFAKACQNGPLLAKVESVEREPAQGIAEKGFMQKPTV